MTSARPPTVAEPPSEPRPSHDPYRSRPTSWRSVTGTTRFVRNAGSDACPPYPINAGDTDLQCEPQLASDPRWPLRLRPIDRHDPASPSQCPHPAPRQPRSAWFAQEVPAWKATPTWPCLDSTGAIRRRLDSPRSGRRAEHSRPAWPEPARCSPLAWGASPRSEEGTARVLETEAPMSYDRPLHRPAPVAEPSTGAVHRRRPPARPPAPGANPVSDP